MKKSAGAICSTIFEYLVLICPTAGLSIYEYQTQLTETMSSSSKGAFWSIISVAIIGAVIFGIFKKKYERFTNSYVQQKTDLETNPDNELLVKKVAEKRTIVEQLDYVVALIPVLLLATILLAFQSCIEDLLIIVWTIAGSLIGKIGLHQLTIELDKQSALKNTKGGDTK